MEKRTLNVSHYRIADIDLILLTIFLPGTSLNEYEDTHSTIRKR